MFNGLVNEIKLLNSNVNNVTNSKRAKQLRKKLLISGIILSLIGYTVCLILFIFLINKILNLLKTSLDSVGDSILVPDFKEYLIPLLLVLPFGSMAIIGTRLARLGLKIVIVGYTSDLVEDASGNRCPNCGDEIVDGELYCSKCGKRLRKECPHCHFVNEPNCEHCVKCGKKLK